MTIQELEQKLNELEANFKAEFYDLQYELAELKESKKEGKWKPEIGEKYWFRNTNSVIGYEHFYLDSCHKWRVENLPVFKTQEECERYWHFMDTVKEKSYEFSKEEWEDVDIPKIIIKRNYEKDYFEVGCFQSIKYFNTTYFKTEEDAQYIIDNFKDELMEYWI